MNTAGVAHGSQRGFTLAELLVVVAIVALIMAGLLTLLMQGNQSFLTGANQVEAQAGARAALERMTEEIRGAGINPTTALPCAGATPNNCPIVGTGCPGNQLTATCLAIQNDNNGNGTFADAGERVMYVLAGTDLQRQAIGIDDGPQTVIGGVAALQFTYWDANGGPLPNGFPVPVAAANIPNIRSIQITITTQPDFAAQPGIWQAGNVQVSMFDRVRLRNR